MPSYQRRTVANEKQAEVEATINSKSADDLRIALLNPFSKASQIQRNLDWERVQNHVYIEEIIHLAAMQQLQVAERERKAILQQQVVAQLEKDQRFNEEYEKHYKAAVKEAEQEKTPVTNTQLTTEELKERIEKFKVEIQQTEKNIEDLTKELATIDRRKGLLIEAWKEFRTEQVKQFTADLKEQNIDLHTPSGAIKADSQEAQDIFNKIFNMAPTELAEKYMSRFAEVAKAYENEARRERKPIETDPAAIMAEKGMSMPATAEEQNKDLTKTNLSLQQVGLIAELAKGATGEELEKFTKLNMPAVAQIILSNLKTEQNMQDLNEKRAEADPNLSGEEKQFRYAATQSSMLNLAAELATQKSEAQSELASEKTKLETQKTQLAQDEKTLDQQMQHQNTPKPE